MLYCEERPYQNANDPSVHKVFRGKQHVHLFADSVKELISFAKEIGMNPGWLQDIQKFPHFDCTGKFMKACLDYPKVTKLSRELFVETYKRIKSETLGKIL